MDDTDETDLSTANVKKTKPAHTVTRNDMQNKQANGLPKQNAKVSNTK